MRTFSHPATRQDVWLREVFPDITKAGTALEVGGYDGITHSNTLMLERFNWDCTLIEAVPEFYEKMVKNRPYATCINAAVAVGEEWGDESMYVNGQYSGLCNAMPFDCIQEHENRKSKEIRVSTKLLPTLTPRRHFDYISLDTEGGEEFILADWFRCGGTCSALSVEFNYDDVKFNRLRHLCAENKMHLDRVQGFDMFFLSDWEK